MAIRGPILNEDGPFGPVGRGRNKTKKIIGPAWDSYGCGVLFAWTAATAQQTSGRFY